MKSIFNRRYLISLFYMMVVTIGAAAWLNIPMELSPDITLPSVTVNYQWGSTSPEVMEQEVTRQVERLAYRLRDVSKVSSITREGRSTVTIEFTKNAPVDYRILELQEYLHGLRQNLPPSISPHSITRRVPFELDDMQTFVTYSLSGPYNTNELLEFARRNIQNPLYGLSGLADIDITGADDPALIVTFNSGMTERYNIDPGQIMGQLNDKLSWRSAGYTDIPEGRNALLVPPEAADINELLQLSVAIPGSARQLTLGEIAAVEVGEYPARQIRRINGTSALSIFFVKEGGADAIGLAEKIHREMDAIRESLPEGMILRMEQDITEDLRLQLSELEQQALISLLCVFVILLLFIRRFRAPFIILGSIIFSILLSIFILYLTGHTINILTLAGLTVSLGMIIDNAVVVFEQVNPRLPAGRDARINHIRRELPHSVVPVLGSTFTTIGIFIPLFFALETLRVFLAPLAIALSLTLAASVLISLTWIPYALIWLVPENSTEKTASKRRSRLVAFIERRINRVLMKLFGMRRRFRWVLYGGLIILIGIPLFAIQEPEWGDEESFLQKTTGWYFDNRDNIDPWVGGITYRFSQEVRYRSPWRRTGMGETITVNVNPPQGSPLDEIDKIIRGFESLGDKYMEALHFYETQVSEYTGARLVFHIKQEYLYNPMPYRLYAEAAFLAARTGNVRISVSGLGDSFATGFGGGATSFNVRFRGYSYEDLLVTAEDLRRRLQTNPRVQNVDINSLFFFREDFYQYQLRLDQDRILAKGLDRRSLLNAVQLDLNPTNTFGRVEFQNQNMYLIGRNQPRGFYQQDFMQASRTYNDINFALMEVSSIERERAMGQIRREDQSYIRQVGFEFLGPHRLGERFLDEVLENLPLPIGTSIDRSRFTFSFQREEDQANVILILFLALLSVWMIVSALLEKWGDPVLVILAVPLSLIGIMAGMIWHGMYLDQGAIAGTLLAVGVVVNNSILLMHDRERNRKIGIHGFRSWLYVYRSKMRPILITTLTTIGGLFPLILIGTSEFWTELATVVVWGLSSSTLFILLYAGIWEKPGSSH